MATKYNRNWFSFLSFTFLSIISLAIASCGTAPTPAPTAIPTKPPPNVKLSVAHVSQEPTGGDVANVHEGEGVAIVVKIEPYESFDWTWDVSGTSGGTLNVKQGENVVYTAGTKGVDVVVAEAKTADGGMIKQQVTINVEATTTVTDTPVPVDTPTAPPPPIACNHPAVTKNLFPQLENVDGQFPMYGPEGDSHILCQAVYDLVHTPGKMAVHFKYENVGTNFGWWGVATPNGYDASQYKQLCFWAYAQVPNQSFRFKMKDMARHEKGIVTTLEKTNEWQQICADLSVFSDLGIQVNNMNNVNLGFEKPTGSSEIWIADFEFK